MRNKRSFIAVLAGVNALLLALLVSQVAPLPSAYAQAGRGGGGGGYVCATARTAGRTFEVLYLIDLPTRKLHAFHPSFTQSRQLSRAEPRDLDKDFGK